MCHPTGWSSRSRALILAVIAALAVGLCAGAVLTIISWVLSQARGE